MHCAATDSEPRAATFFSRRILSRIFRRRSSNVGPVSNPLVAVGVPMEAHRPLARRERNTDMRRLAENFSSRSRYSPTVCRPRATFLSASARPECPFRHLFSPQLPNKNPFPNPKAFIQLRTHPKAAFSRHPSKRPNRSAHLSKASCETSKKKLNLSLAK